MILVDANLLVYALVHDFGQHARARIADARVRGDLVPETDGDFARFPGLRFENPLAGPGED